MAALKNRVKYSKLRETVDDSEKRNGADSNLIKSKKSRKKELSGDGLYYDDQFEDTTPIKPPIKSICIAVILFVLGTIMLTMGSLMLAGVIKQGGGSFRAAPLMVIGSIIFIPGAYNVRTAYYAWKGYSGFSYSDIAGFGEGQ